MAQPRNQQMVLPDSARCVPPWHRWHTPPLHLEFCTGGGERGPKRKTQITPTDLLSLGVCSPCEHSIVSVKSQHSAKMPTLLRWRKTLKISGESKLCSPESSSGMERNALLNPSPASGHDTGPNPFMHQIRLCW